MNDGRNYAPAHRWAVMEPRPLCFGRLSSWYEAYESPELCPFAGFCAHLVRCEEAGHDLKNSDEARSAALARSYIREAHELRKDVDDLRNTLFASMSPCVRCGLAKQKLRLVQWQSGLYSVMCMSCGGGCSCHSAQGDAIRAWNTRGLEDANDRIEAYEIILNEDRQRIAALEAESAALRRIMPPLNVVTARHRHGQPVEEHHLTALANRQIEVEQAVREARGEHRCPDCGHRLDTEECGCARGDV